MPITLTSRWTPADVDEHARDEAPPLAVVDERRAPSRRRARARRRRSTARRAARSRRRPRAARRSSDHVAHGRARPRQRSTDGGQRRRLDARDDLARRRRTAATGCDRPSRAARAPDRSARAAGRASARAPSRTRRSAAARSPWCSCATATQYVRAAGAHVPRAPRLDERLHRVDAPGEREEHQARAVDPHRRVVAAGADVLEPREHARGLIEIAGAAVRAEQLDPHRRRDAERAAQRDRARARRVALLGRRVAPNRCASACAIASSQRYAAR